MESFFQSIQMLSIQLVPFIMAVVFHEYAHGMIAYYFGDSTARAQGRLTLNPIPHIDPMGTLIFPILSMLTGMHILFGWAKPVPINPNRFKKYRSGLFWVALAGPGMNFSLAILSAFILCCLESFIPRNFYLHEPLIRMAFVSISLNYSLGIFNLIPLPPLDGSKMIDAFLSPQKSIQYRSLSQYSFFILTGLLMSGALSLLSHPIIFCTEFTLAGMSRLFGIP